MALRSLPDHPDLAELEGAVEALRSAHGQGRLPAAARIKGQHPRWRPHTLPEILAAELPLADAQLVIAREYGFESWTALRRHVEVAAEWARLTPHPGFDEALAAFD